MGDLDWRYYSILARSLLCGYLGQDTGEGVWSIQSGVHSPHSVEHLLQHLLLILLDKWNSIRP